MEMGEYNRSEKFSHYIEKLEFFFIANGIEDTPENSERQKAMLLSIIKSKTYGLVRDLLAPNRVTDKSYSEIEIKKQHF